MTDDGWPARPRRRRPEPRGEGSREDDGQGTLGERVSRLEEYRDNHRETHDKYVADKQWVYAAAAGAGFALLGAAVALTAVLVRLFTT